MQRVAVDNWQVLVLASGETKEAKNNAKGHLFEVFVALLLHQYGYEKPTRDRLQVLVDGIELDVTAKSTFSNDSAIVECKSYTSNVPASACINFLGKLQLARYEQPATKGYLFVIPRLASTGRETARTAQKHDRNFHYLDVDAIVARMHEREMIRPLPSSMGKVITSDPAILISEFGIFTCTKILSAKTHRAERICIWGNNSSMRVPQPLMDQLSSEPYAENLTLEALDDLTSTSASSDKNNPNPPVIVPVRGSSADFEYQFPASPKFFVGRKSTVQELASLVAMKRGTIVLNAQSGWGKSSLALQLENLVQSSGGYAMVVDTRTASSPQFVTEVLREVALKAEQRGVIRLPQKTSWAGLTSAIRTYEQSTWKDNTCITIFFDQFEIVFQDEVTTREFRNLAFAINDTKLPMLIGFAWKTDLLGWTESHPFRLRDEIRGTGHCINIGPMGARDIDTLLRRLQKRVGGDLSYDLKQRLREYSQGLPWLFKKLAGHVIREIEEHKSSQEKLVSEGLKVQRLFESDLQGLSPVENEALRHVALYAPVPATEVTEKYDAHVLRSLLNSRLIVAVGDKLDTYWDIFRDFLNTGRVPIEETYTVRSNPRSVAILLRAVFDAGGNVGVPDLCSHLNKSPGGIYNLSRELRLFGLSAYEPNRVRLLDEVIQAEDRENGIRRRVNKSLSRHRAYKHFCRLAERFDAPIALSAFARELKEVFPAVDAQSKTWVDYARAFSLWFEYAGLAVMEGNDVSLPPENFPGKGDLLKADRTVINRVKFSLYYSPGPCLELLLKLAEEPSQLTHLTVRHRRLIVLLAYLDLVEQDEEGLVRPRTGAVVEGKPCQETILRGLLKIPGGDEALELLKTDPRVENVHIGQKIQSKLRTHWEDITITEVGGEFRSWAKVAGINVGTARRKMKASKTSTSSVATSQLFIPDFEKPE